ATTAREKEGLPPLRLSADVKLEPQPSEPVADSKYAAVGDSNPHSASDVRLLYLLASTSDASVRRIWRWSPLTGSRQSPRLCGKSPRCSRSSRCLPKIRLPHRRKRLAPIDSTSWSCRNVVLRTYMINTTITSSSDELVAAVRAELGTRDELVGALGALGAGGGAHVEGRLRLLLGVVLHLGAQLALGLLQLLALLV